MHCIECEHGTMMQLEPFAQIGPIIADHGNRDLQTMNRHLEMITSAHCPPLV